MGLGQVVNPGQQPLSDAAKRAMAKQAPDGVRRSARAGACRRCGAMIMSGLDADRAGWAVAVDPYPLSGAGELAALLTGRQTYSLIWIAGLGRYEIDFRYPENIEHEPPGSKANRDVVVRHSCHAVRLPAMRTSIAHVQKSALPDDPPF